MLRRCSWPRTLGCGWAACLTLLLCGCPATETPPSGSPAPPSGVTPSDSATPEPEVESEEPDEPFEYEADFQRLSLADFTTFPEQVATWSERGDRLISTGKPRGYAYTRESYSNFTFRCEYRFPRPAGLQDDDAFKGNTGFLVYITGPAKVWPLSLEVQGKYAEMAAIKENGGAEAPTITDDPAMRLSLRRPVGEWNALEIVSHDGALNVSLNGVAVTASEPNFLSSGSLGIQAEDHPFEVRRIRIRRDE